MRIRTLVVLLAAVGAVALWSAVTTAQVIDDSGTCEQSCYERKAMCVEACGEHTDPVECEGGCSDDLRDCVRDCR